MQYELIKCGEKDSTINFPHPDDEKRWRIQRKLQGEGWKYRSLHKKNPIYFNKNSMGYRTHEFDFENDDKYILALGCSNTYGLYLHEEERYSNLIEEATGIKTYNLGICGGSSNIIMMNLLKFLHTSPKKPDAVLIQWPEHMRICLPFTEPHTGVFNIRASTKRKIKRSSVFEQFVKHGNVIETHSQWAKDTTFEMLKSFSIKNISFSKDEEDSIFYDVPYVSKVDKAYDDKHNGTETNKNISKFILENL